MQYFGPKIRFLIWDRDFRQWTVCSPRRCGRFGAFGSIFRLFVPELWPFSWPTSANFGSILPDGNRKLPRKIFPFIWSKIGGNRLVSVSFGRKTQFPRTVLRTPVKVVLRRGCRFLGQYPSKMYDFFSWAPFTKRDDYQPPPGPFNWSKTHSTGPSGFYHWIDAVAPFHHRAIHSPIWRGRQNVVATQIQTDGRMLTKLFAHVLDTQIQLLDQTHPPHPRRNPLKKGSLSENATKRRRRRQKINRRASHCGDF